MSHRGHLQLCIGVQCSVFLGVFVCVMETERCHMSGTLCAPDDPKTPLKEGQEKVEIVESRERERHRQAGRQAGRDLFNKAQQIPVRMILLTHPLSVGVEISQLNN